MTTTSVAIPRPAVSRARPSVARTLAAAALALGLAGGATAGKEIADADQRSRCEAAREQSGYGRNAALRALDDPQRPDAQRRFLYRVLPGADSYRAFVVVRDGPFAGDAWSRDAEGRVRHHSDLCRDGFNVDGIEGT